MDAIDAIKAALRACTRGNVLTGSDILQELAKRGYSIVPAHHAEQAARLREAADVVADELEQLARSTCFFRDGGYDTCTGDCRRRREALEDYRRVRDA